MTKRIVIAICFGQFGPYHHARVAALQEAAEPWDIEEGIWKMGESMEDGGRSTANSSHATRHMPHPERSVRVIPVQISSATATYEWKESNESLVTGKRCEGLRTLCEDVEETASPVEVFFKARRLFKEEGVGVAFLPSYSPARYFALFAAAKSLGIRTVMMNESHAGTERATGSSFAQRVSGVTRRWIKRQIVRRFDAALVGGEPHRRNFASLGIPRDKIFTGYDAVDGAFFAQRADEIRSAQRRSDEWRVTGDEREGGKVSESRQSSVGSSPGGQVEDLAVVGEDSAISVFQHFSVSDFRKKHGLPERYFLSLGRMVPKKNLSTLVEAYAQFARTSVEVKSGGSKDASKAYHTSPATRHSVPALVFVGSGEEEEALEALARSLELKVIDRRNMGVCSVAPVSPPAGSEVATGDEDIAATVTCHSSPVTRHEENCGAVFFYGFRQIEENPVFYALAEAFVLPSLYEEWGLVVNEAMACSLPVIVSRTAGCAEDLVPASGQVTGGEWRVTGEKSANCKLKTENSLEQRSNGFVFDPTSVEALATALARVAEGVRRSEREEEDGIWDMRKRSREIVEKFSCENFAKQALRAAKAAG